MNVRAEVSDAALGTEPVSLGAAVYDPRARALYVAGRRHALEPKLAGVLALLVAQAGAPVTRDALLDAVWGDAGSDEALTQAVSRLRRLLGDADAIATLPRVGYQLAVEPRPAGAAPSVGPRAALAAWLRARGPRVGSHAAAFAAGFALAAAVAAVWIGTHTRVSLEKEIVITGPATEAELVRLAEE